MTQISIYISERDIEEIKERKQKISEIAGKTIKLNKLYEIAVIKLLEKSDTEILEDLKQNRLI